MESKLLKWQVSPPQVHHSAHTIGQSRTPHLNLRDMLAVIFGRGTSSDRQKRDYLPFLKFFLELPMQCDGNGRATRLPTRRNKKRNMFLKKKVSGQFCRSLACRYQVQRRRRRRPAIACTGLSKKKLTNCPCNFCFVCWPPGTAPGPFRRAEEAP